MLTPFTNLHQHLSNIFIHLSNILYNIFNNHIISYNLFYNSITTYCVIFIIVLLTLLGFVLYAEEKTKIPVASLVNTQAELDQKANDNNIAINMSFRHNVDGLGTAAFLYDMNESDGLRMLRLLPNRAGSLRTINGVVGIVYRDNPNHTTGVNGQGNLLIHVNNSNLAIVDSARPILTRGLPVQRNLPARPFYPVTVLTILPANNNNAN